MRLLTVRATADLLGVHENTVRHWEERGILRAIRLPGSGFRRFPHEQVLALAQQMRASGGTMLWLPQADGGRNVLALTATHPWPHQWRAFPV